MLPFRVSGTDTSYAEGLAELMALEFPGTGGPRAVDVGATVRAWRRAGGSVRQPLDGAGATRVATQLGAGQTLIGSAIGVAGRVTLSAAILDQPSGTERARARVDGPLDSLPVLVPRLAVNLLAGASSAGVNAATVGTQSAEALRPFLAGSRALRDGRYRDAATLLRQALAQDSNFVLAARRLQATDGWLLGAPGSLTAEEAARIQGIVRRNVDRMPQRERTVYDAQRAPVVTPAERGELLERAAAQLVDDPNAWYIAGDWFFHSAASAGVPFPERRAEALFRRSLAIDSSYASPLSHLISTLIMYGNRDGLGEARRLGVTLLRIDSSDTGGGADAAFNRFLLAAAFNDPAQLRELYRRLEANPPMIRFVLWTPFLSGYGADQLDRLLALRDRYATTQAERRRAADDRAMVLFSTGRPKAGAAALDSGGLGPILRDVYVVQAALDWNGDSALAAAAVERLGALTPDTTGGFRTAACVVARWRLRHDGAAYEFARSRLVAAGGQGTTCAVVLDAEAAVRAREPDARAAVQRADSILVAGGALGSPLSVYNAALSRLFLTLGDTAAAYRAIRRGGGGGLHRTWALYSGLPLARVAAAAGDTATARRGYRVYLNITTAPEPALIPQRDSARAELARLERR